MAEPFSAELLAERDRRRELLRQELKVGRDALDRGDYHEYDEVSLRAYFDELQERGKRRFEASRQTS